MYFYYVAPEHNDENDGEAKDFSQAIEAQKDDDFKRVRRSQDSMKSDPASSNTICMFSLTALISLRIA